MRLFPAGRLAVLLIATMIFGCQSKARTPLETNHVPKINHPVKGTVVWGGVVNESRGVFELNAQVDQALKLFSTDSLAWLDIAPGAGQFLLVMGNGQVIFRTTEGEQNVTSAVSPARLSPNGRRVLFVQDGTLYQASSAGTGALPIAEGAVRPAFSQDMTRLAFTTEAGFFAADVGAIDPLPIFLNPGGVIVTDDPDPDLYPVFSPDGTKVAAPVTYQNDVGTSNILMFLIDVENQLQITWIGNARHPSWASDSKRVAYESNGLIYLWDMDANQNYQLSFNNEGSDFRPEVSPDDQYVLITRKYPPGEYLTAIHISASDFYNLTDDRSSPIAGADWARKEWCPSDNAAPAVTAAQAMVDGSPASAPVNVPSGSTVTVQLTLTDADCNLTHGIAFAANAGEPKRALRFDFPENAGCDTTPVEVPVPTDYSGDTTLTFAIEDDCGASGAGVDVEFLFEGGGDDDADDTSDDTGDDTSADDTAVDDTGDDTAG